MDLFVEDNSINQIPGLKLIPNYISAEQEQTLIHNIDNQPWLSDLKRRVQHYGYKYDYKARSIDQKHKLSELPEWLSFYTKQLAVEKLFGEMPDQIIVNEYQPGQGISAHTDCIPCFGDTIASLNLGSQCVMEFSHPVFKGKVVMQLLPRSLLILAGDARYKWLHAIPLRKSDKLNEVTYQRSRRISLTFRKVVINYNLYIT